MPDSSLLNLQDLKTCAANYRWHGEPVGPLIDRFAQDSWQLGTRLTFVDDWTRAKGKAAEMSPLATGEARQRLDALFGERATVGEARAMAQGPDPKRFVVDVVRAVAGGLDQRVPSGIAFPVTTLLRCLNPDRFCILATPHDVTAAVTPHKLHRRQIAERLNLGLESLEAWDSVESFAQDYDAYAMRLRGMRARHGFNTPGEIDDGCWQMSLCLSGTRQCPGRGKQRLCGSGRKAIRDPRLKGLIGHTQRRAKRGELDARGRRLARLKLFRLILDQSGETSAFHITWEDALRLLLPDPDVVRLVFSQARRERGTRGSGHLQWLERSFGHHIVTALGEDWGPRANVIGKYLDTQESIVKRKLEPPARPEG